MTDFPCVTCTTRSLEVQADYAALPRVTSDCRPWPAGGTLAVCGSCGTIQKLPDETWFEEIGRIYGTYEIYELSDGAEQAIFTADGTATPRSRALVDHVLSRTGAAQASGRLIDIGCGNGAALGRFGAALPGWALYGHELSDRNAAAMRAIPGFRELFTCPIEEIPGRFDLVSMIHSLEHFPVPKDALSTAARLMDDEAWLLVEVPDAETSPFDLLVADHRTHFTRATLGRLARAAGIETVELVNTVLPKELTLLGQRGTPAAGEPTDPADGHAVARRTLAWLTGILETARAAAVCRPFGIFGSSIAGMWLYGDLADRVDFFVDEDATRIGRTIEERPILAPKDIPESATVFLPLAPQVCENVISRLSHLPADFVAPAPL